MHDRVGGFEKCSYCGKRFKVKTIWHSYCNDKCRMSDFYVRRGKEAEIGKQIGNNK